MNKSGKNKIITEYSLKGETLRWSDESGADEYRIVDLDYSSSARRCTRYDMSDKNIVRYVYPVCGKSAETVTDENSVTIKYLEGSGTESDPYIIRTPFDLRCIDYYEALYAERGGERNRYKIVNDIDFEAVAAPESESNIHTLGKPFFGELDGGGKKLIGIRAVYDGGYFALFDFISRGGKVKNIVFENPEITNELQDKHRPLNASVATVAYKNYGTVSGIVVYGARYYAAGGGIGGIVARNFGVVENCTFGGAIRQLSTGLNSQACYEMAGIALENGCGGVVKDCEVSALDISGSACDGAFGTYNNVRTAAGIVAVCRAGGIVKNCGYALLTMNNMLDNYDARTFGSEWGGIVAYNAGDVNVRKEALGTFRWGASDAGVSVIKQAVGTDNDMRGKIVGKNDGTAEEL